MSERDRKAQFVQVFRESPIAACGVMAEDFLRSKGLEQFGSKEGIPTAPLQEPRCEERPHVGAQLGGGHLLQPSFIKRFKVNAAKKVEVEERSQRALCQLITKIGARGGQIGQWCIDE
jgi:hypothetical protein